MKMEETIKVMKETGLFQSLASTMFNDPDFGIEQVGQAINVICGFDEDFSDIFCAEADDVAVGIIYKALQEEQKTLSMQCVDVDKVNRECKKILQEDKKMQEDKTNEFEARIQETILAGIEKFFEALSDDRK